MRLLGLVCEAMLFLPIIFDRINKGDFPGGVLTAIFWALLDIRRMIYDIYFKMKD